MDFFEKDLLEIHYFKFGYVNQRNKRIFNFNKTLIKSTEPF